MKGIGTPSRTEILMKITIFVANVFLKLLDMKTVLIVMLVVHLLKDVNVGDVLRGIIKRDYNDL